MNDMNELKKSVNDDMSGLGLQRTGRDEWHWSSGEPALYLNWGEKQPDGRDECAAMLNGQWHDSGCKDTCFSSATTVSLTLHHHSSLIDSTYTKF